jgi:hypothetical protein
MSGLELEGTARENPGSEEDEFFSNRLVNRLAFFKKAEGSTRFVSGGMRAVCLLRAIFSRMELRS